MYMLSMRPRPASSNAHSLGAYAVTAERHCGFERQVVEKRAGLGQETVDLPRDAAPPRQVANFGVLAVADAQHTGGIFTFYLSPCTEFRNAGDCPTGLRGITCVNPIHNKG